MTLEELLRRLNLPSPLDSLKRTGRGAVDVAEGTFNAVTRGVPQQATGFVDLAALPFTMSGLLDEKDVVGGTKYLTERGLLQQEPDSFAGKSAETGISMFSPAGMAKGLLGLGAIGMAAAKGSKPVRSLLNESKFVPGVESGSELLVQHNLKPQSVMFAEEFGGLPVPSLAVSKASEPLTNFGDISLIGTKEMAQPSASNPVYAFDAYTKRNPRVITRLNEDSNEAVTKEFLQGFGKFSTDTSALGEASGIAKDLRNNLDMTIGKMQFMRSINALPDPSKFDRFYDFQLESSNKFNELYAKDPSLLQKFEDWTIDKFKELQERGVTNDVIYKGRTATGKEKYEPATIETLVKATKGKAGEEGGMGQMSLGAIRSKISPKFKNFKDVQAARERIVPEETFLQMRDEIAAKDDDILYKLKDIAEQNGVKLSYDGAKDLREDLYLGAIGKFDYSKPLVGKIPKELLEEAEQFKKDLASLPTQYFEVKPQRAVPLSDFAGAIIPIETPQTVIDSLKRQGITNIQVYRNADERKKLVNKFGDKMFQIGAGTAVGAGGLLGIDEEQY